MCPVSGLRSTSPKGYRSSRSSTSAGDVRGEGVRGDRVRSKRVRGEGVRGDGVRGEGVSYMWGERLLVSVGGPVCETVMKVE